MVGCPGTGLREFRKNDCGEEVIRIIPTRRAEEREIRRYQDQALD
jgi:uncharacterized DUF497 family protein